MVCEYSARSRESRSGPGCCQSPPNPHRSWNTLVYKSKLIKLIPSSTANIADKINKLLFPVCLYLSLSLSLVLGLLFFHLSQNFLTTLPFSAHLSLSLSLLFLSLSLSYIDLQVHTLLLPMSEDLLGGPDSKSC